MDPENFLEETDVIPLVLALNKFAIDVNDPDTRQDVLTSAGIDPSFLSNLKFSIPANRFSQSLVAAFHRHQVSKGQLGYHPMVSFLRYLVGLSSIYSFSDQDIALFNRLIEQSYEKFKILTCRNAVGRIESPQGTGIGTGLLVSNNLFLTCHHIFTKAQLKQAWVRFGYMAGGSMMKDVFELELGPISHSRQLDYALTQLKGFPRIQPVIPVPSQLNSGEKIRAIHYPFGGECVISKPGTVLQVGEGYIDHTVWTENGSSGAPLFDKNWDVIAIHQGQPGISRKVTQKALGGIPIRVVWEHIKGHINK